MSLGVLVVPLLPNLDVLIKAQARLAHLGDVAIPFLVDATALHPLGKLVVRVVGDGGVVVLQSVGVFSVRTHIDRHHIIDGIDMLASRTHSLIGGSYLISIGVVDHGHIIANPAAETILQRDGTRIRIFGVCLVLINGVLMVAIVGDDIGNGAKVALDRTPLRCTWRR